jgi:hypothetical protein
MPTPAIQPKANKMLYRCPKTAMEFPSLDSCDLYRQRAGQGKTGDLTISEDYALCLDCPGPEPLLVKGKVKIAAPALKPAKPAPAKVPIVCGYCKKSMPDGDFKPDGSPYRTHAACRQKQAALNRQRRTAAKAPPESASLPALSEAEPAPAFALAVDPSLPELPTVELLPPAPLSAALAREAILETPPAKEADHRCHLCGGPVLDESELYLSLRSPCGTVHQRLLLCGQPHCSTRALMAIMQFLEILNGARS